MFLSKNNANITEYTLFQKKTKQTLRKLEKILEKEKKT